MKRKLIQAWLLWLMASLLMLSPLGGQAAGLDGMQSPLYQTLTPTQTPIPVETAPLGSNTPLVIGAAVLVFIVGIGVLWGTRTRKR